MVRERAPMLGRTFWSDTGPGFGKRASMRFRAPSLPMPLAGPDLSTTFLRAPCVGASRPADDSPASRFQCSPGRDRLHRSA
jgi:hypothetical protein